MFMRGSLAPSYLWLQESLLNQYPFSWPVPVKSCSRNVALTGFPVAENTVSQAPGTTILDMATLHRRFMIPVNKTTHHAADAILITFTLVGVFSFAVVSPLKAADDCSQGRMRTAYINMKSVQAQLLAVQSGFMDTSVAELAQTQIRTMKDALNDAINSFMSCQRESAISDSSLTNRLAATLDANKPEKAPKDFPDPIPDYAVGDYGENLQISAARADPKLNLLAIKASFSITCGQDTMLLIYEWRDRNWKQALRWQSDAYGEISRAFGDIFQYVILPRDPPIVAVAHGHPWCTSVWSGFDLDVIKLGSANNPQQLLLHRTEGYNRGADEAAAMRKTAQGFELRVRDMSLDFETVFVKPVIYRYRVSDNQVRRVQPIAVNGRDFVDVWLQSKWTEASEWSSNENLDALKNEHLKFEAQRSSIKGSPISSFGAVRSCSDKPNTYQVEVDQEPGGPTYYEIREGQNSFTMLWASVQPNLHCDSGDLMETRKSR
jgi:hypothetical protein